MRLFTWSCLIVIILSVLILGQEVSYPDQVKAIQNDPRVQAANEYIDKNHENILREWIAITEINAPSKHEEERARYIESLLRKYKLDVHYDGAGNLIATRKGTGTGPVTVFDAHMDTVFQPGLTIKATVKDGRVYAPGIGDDTRNIEALLASIRALDVTKLKTKGDLIFVFTTDEEAGMSGAKFYTKENKGKINYYVALWTLYFRIWTLEY
jgi:acetylornithine deacetylase/succinyl-diaminopimelate desuccinylase-like protein